MKKLCLIYPIKFLTHGIFKPNREKSFSCVSNTNKFPDTVNAQKPCASICATCLNILKPIILTTECYLFFPFSLLFNDAVA
jgi:hypothetical protein